jgi:hypothetical protein
MQPESWLQALITNNTNNNNIGSNSGRHRERLVAKSLNISTASRLKII